MPGVFEHERYALKKRALMLSAATVALLSGSALADTDITKQVTSPINTATDGNITIESDGSVVITANSPTVAAVTLNSDAIVNNEGTISYKGVSNATGVELVTGYTGEFEETGAVDLTGTGTGKTGILISGIASDPDSGTFTGVIPSGGTSPVAINIESGAVVKVQGDTSFGINELYGTNIAGDIDIAGDLSIVPTSANSTKSSIGNVIAINLAGTMTGNLDIQTGGVVTATGEGAEGIQLLGNLTGSVINEGTLQTYGTTVSNPTSTNLPQAGTALGIAANVTGGIYNSGPSTTSDTTTGRAIISTVGDAPAVLINPTIDNATPTAPLVIGAYNDTTDPGYSFLNRGTISGASSDANIGVTTVSIVGASTLDSSGMGAPTELLGGFFNGGTISAAATTNTSASTVSANALFIGNYAYICGPGSPVQECTAGTGNGLTNSNESNGGLITASVVGPESGTAAAITIEQFANLTTINNSGTISATATTTNPQFVTSLTAYGIFDESGTLNSITNTGTISATANTLANNAQVAIAVDLAVNTSGVNFLNEGKVVGDVYFGTGNDNFTIEGNAETPASFTGNLYFGGTTGGDDVLNIDDFSTESGAIVEKLGSVVDVTIASGGTLILSNTPQNLGTNNVVGLHAGKFDVDSGANMTLFVSQPFNRSVNPQTGALIDSQSAFIGNDADISILFGSYVGNFVPGRGLQSGNQTAVFDLLSAPNGQLQITGSEIAQINNSFKTTIPFLFTGDICTWNVNGNSTCTGANPGDSEVDLDLTPKSAQTLGLTGYALKMFPYANESLVYDNNLGAAMLNDITNAQQAQSAYAAFAPDVSGASRALAISLTDDATNVVAARQRVLREYANQDGDLTMWTQEFVERLNQDNTIDGSGFTDSGFGFVLGADEGDPADGRYGGAFTFFSGGMSGKAPLIQKTQSEWYMLTGYTDWHGRGFFLDTQASVGYAHLDGSRTLDLDGFIRTATNTRPAEYLAGGATAGLQYNVIGAAVMPQISVDGLAMRQEGYTDRTVGAGLSQDENGFDLHVEPNYAASARVFAGIDTRDDINLGDFLLQPEARAGYRYDFANGQESVTANFIDVTPIDQFKISGPKPANGNALGGLGVSLATGAWSLGLSFDYLYANSGNTSEEGTLTLIGRI
jgi:hypothetical protein